MAQTKNKRPTKPKHQDSGKKRGKQADLTQFRIQLDALGLKVIAVTSDGNCFFRALADQLEGDEEEHKKYRHMVVQFIANHREEFEPFIEDEVPFDEYCKSMEEDGTWAGNMELQAASLVTRCNICIHRLMSPRWHIRNFSSHEARMIHLSYHDGEHYNSVRLKEDPCGGPAKRITIKVDADIAKASHQAKVTGNQSKATSCGNNTDMISVKLVMCGTGCENYSKAEQILKEVDGDADAAIEYLIAEQRTNEDANTNYEISSGSSISHEHENGICKQMCVKGDHVEGESDLFNTTSELINDLGVEHDDEKVSREKRLPKGSKMKQKMNGSASKRSPAAFVINEKPNVGKGKKERRNLRKGSACNARSSACDQGNLPDVGSLCI